MTHMKRTHARERTASSRKRAGSRKGNGRQWRWADTAGPEYEIGTGIPANHAARFQTITDLFPAAPGQSQNPVKRWP